MKYNVSKYGVAYDLASSPYVADCAGYVFHFSTMAHMRKFVNGVQSRIDWLNDSLSRRFHMTIIADEIAIMQWYSMCETRGFLVLAPDGKRFKCPENIIFRGMITSGKD